MTKRLMQRFSQSNELTHAFRRWRRRSGTRLSMGRSMEKQRRSRCDGCGHRFCAPALGKQKSRQCLGTHARRDGNQLMRHNAAKHKSPWHVDVELGVLLEALLRGPCLHQPMELESQSSVSRPVVWKSAAVGHQLKMSMLRFPTYSWNELL